LALLSGAVVLAGWGAAGFAGLPVGFPDGAHPSKEERATLASPVVGDATTALSTASAPAAAHQNGNPESPDRGLNALLFSPRFIAPPPASATVPAPAVRDGAITPDAEPPAAVPLPPPRQRADPGAVPAPSTNNARTRQRPPRDTFQGPFTLDHIARIRQRLRLTSEQEEHWRPVEAALKRIALRQQGRGGPTVLNATESQELYWAAGPLIMSLSPDQKEEVRRLARSMGLETVASLI
jgi:hypothetical protein